MGTRACRDTEVSISALSDRIAQRGDGLGARMETRVSISALSDRIAQRRSGDEYHDGSNVSISALSDRIAQLVIGLQRELQLTGFNIRSFGSNCSALSPAAVALMEFTSFNIRSFGSNCSACNT